MKFTHILLALCVLGITCLFLGNGDPRWLIVITAMMFLIIGFDIINANQKIRQRLREAGAECKRRRR